MLEQAHKTGYVSIHINANQKQRTSKELLTFRPSVGKKQTNACSITPLRHGWMPRASASSSLRDLTKKRPTNKEKSWKNIQKNKKTPLNLTVADYRIHQWTKVLYETKVGCHFVDKQRKAARASDEFSAEHVCGSAPRGMARTPGVHSWPKPQSTTFSLRFFAVCTRRLCNIQCLSKKQMFGVTTVQSPFSNFTSPL